MQIGIRFIVERNDPMYMGNRRAAEAVRLNGAGDLRTNGPRNDLRLCRAEAVRQVDFLRRKIYAEAFRADILSPPLRLRIGQQQEAIAVFEGGLESADGFVPKGEIRQGDCSFETDQVMLVPAAPDFAIQMRRLGEANQIQMP